MSRTEVVLREKAVKTYVVERITWRLIKIREATEVLKILKKKTSCDVKVMRQHFPFRTDWKVRLVIIITGRFEL